MYINKRTNQSHINGQYLPSKYHTLPTIRKRFILNNPNIPSEHYQNIRFNPI